MATDAKPSDVARYLRDFIDGTGGVWDWDDFTSVPIADARLEAIRQEAGLIPLPVDEAGFDRLRDLLQRAGALEG
jgi:hypothetical protein